MRLMMTEEMLVIWREIEPYYNEFHHLRADAPEEIRQKEKKLHEMQEQQYREAMRIELGFDVDWPPKKNTK